MTDIYKELEDLKRDIGYHESPEDADFEVDDSVDALIDYKNALEDLVVAKEKEAGRFARELEGMLYPERFPPGHERHDPEHIYWMQYGDDVGVDGRIIDEPFQWSADTIEWVAEAVARELQKITD